MEKAYWDKACGNRKPFLESSSGFQKVPKLCDLLILDNQSIQLGSVTSHNKSWSPVFEKLHTLHGLLLPQGQVELDVYQGLKSVELVPEGKHERQDELTSIDQVIEV